MLRNCAGSLGLDLDASKTVEIQDDGEGVEEQDKDKPTKLWNQSVLAMEVANRLLCEVSGLSRISNPNFWCTVIMFELLFRPLSGSNVLRFSLLSGHRKVFTARTDGSCFTT